ncbi:hypothetical protein [Mucilaginibacter sp.]
MNFSLTKKINITSFLWVILATMFFVSCNRSKVHNNIKKPLAPLSFKSIAGINFTEVRRRMANGLSFDKNGFEAEPGYKITFLTNDSASVWSPDKKAFINFLVFLEPDSIFNVARSYFKMKHMSKDSLVLQVLEVQGDTLHMKHSLVYMTFYSNEYLKNVLHTDAQTLGKPDRRDTLFIEHKAAVAEKNPDSAFAGRQPVELKSLNSLLTIDRVNVKPDISNNYDASDYYMDPEFNITINKAYEDFSYSFWVCVDAKGQITFYRSIDYIMPEFRESTIKTIKAIIAGYLKAYMAATPGSTLGIKHTSWVILNVVGKK